MVVNEKSMQLHVFIKLHNAITTNFCSFVTKKVYPHWWSMYMHILNLVSN